MWAGLRAGVAVLSLVVCARDAPARRVPPCVEGSHPDPALARALFSLLATHPEGASVLALAPPETALCVGEPEVTAVTTDGVLYLDARWSLPESAARAAHLLAHLVERTAGLVDGARGRDCDRRVRLAVASEARALALELRLRRALSARPLPARYAFEGAFWRTPDHARHALLARYLHDHPDGAPGLDALVRGYRARCEAAP